MNRAASAAEKLMVRLNLAREYGREFDEVLERAVLGLPPVEKGRTPIQLEASSQRKRQFRQDDEDENFEIREEAENASAADQMELVSQLLRQNQQLMAQIAELTGQKDAPLPAMAPAPASVPALENIVGEPNEHWTRQQLIQFAKDRGYEFDRKFVFQSKQTWWNFVREQMEQELEKVG